MAAEAAANTLRQYVFDGSISMCDNEIERRPYHRNCSCALHNLKGTVAYPYSCPARRNSLSFPKKQQQQHSLCVRAFSFSSSSSSISAAAPSSSLLEASKFSSHSFNILDESWSVRLSNTSRRVEDR